MIKEIKKEISLKNGGCGSEINIACSPFEFLKDEFAQNEQKKFEFKEAIKANNLEYEYALFKKGAGINRELLSLISYYFGNYDFWLNISLKYLSFIAQLHFQKRIKNIRK